MWMSLVSGMFTNAVKPIIDSVFPDPADKHKAMELQAEMEKAFSIQVARQSEALASMVAAESASESWLTRNWRPISMIVFLFVIVYDTVLEAYAVKYFRISDTAVPEQIWSIMFAMFGIYGGDRAIRYGSRAIGEAVAKAKG